eukprot:CAMPEP_0195596668 /NCGR_PEP_ID=MMETSP0815-20121206/2580_1 /TAXON_ID=97485 /ORGANISM="Prymnesium parvum, Strain Texoma1" /LENGTH=231 /DNA_ID=CAMNT_0040735969 /DNA_START=360 /DNA_END=1053 /DNA_ORIENTATION=+
MLPDPICPPAKLLAARSESPHSLPSRPYAGVPPYASFCTGHARRLQHRMRFGVRLALVPVADPSRGFGDDLSISALKVPLELRWVSSLGLNNFSPSLLLFEPRRPRFGGNEGSNTLARLANKKEPSELEVPVDDCRACAKLAASEVGAESARETIARSVEPAARRGGLGGAAARAARARLPLAHAAHQPGHAHQVPPLREGLGPLLQRRAAHHPAGAHVDRGGHHLRRAHR